MNSTPVALAALLVGILAACERGPGGTDDPATEVEESTVAAATAGERSCDLARLSATFMAALEGWTASGTDLTLAELQVRLEAGVNVTLIAEPSCAEWSWNGLDGVVTFDGCTLKGSGEPIDGRIEVTASLEPAGLALAFEGLVIGDAALTGTVDLAAGDATAGEGITLAADLGASLTLTGATLSLDDSGVTLDGAGTTIVASGEEKAVVLTGVRIEGGDCLPSAGSLSIESSAEVVLTFLATTPEDGIVAVEAAGSGELRYESRFEPCP